MGNRFQSRFVFLPMPFASSLVLIVLFLFNFSEKLFAQIGTNPQNPYSGSQNQSYPGSQNNQNANKGIKQDSGSLKNVYYSESVKLISEKNLKNDSLTLNALDTTLKNVENYSPLYQPANYYLNLGNLGLAAKPLFPEFNLQTGFSNGQNSFSLYVLKPEDIRYYRNKSPYTDLFFITGKGQKSGFSEGIFSFVHARNINPRLNIGISYYRVGSNGYFARQSSDVLNAAAFAWYQSKNLRYNLVANFIANTITSDENGGLRNDDVFNGASSTQHQYEPVYLNGAHTKWNDYGLYVKQYYLIGRIDSVRDSVTKQIKVYPTARAYYTFHNKSSTYEYYDNFSSGSSSSGFNGAGPGGSNQNAIPALFYPNIFLDTLKTNDLISQSKIDNDFGLSIFGRGNRGDDHHFSASGIRLDAFIRDEFIHYKQNHKIDSTFNNLILGANAGYDLSNRFNINLEGSYVLAGPNHFDTYLAASARLTLGKILGQFNFKASFQSNSPELTYNRYESNSYSWRFHFDKEKVKFLSAFYLNEKFAFKVGAEYNLIDHYLYFAGIANQVVFPTQYPAQVNILRAYLDKEIRFGHFGIQAHLVYQRNNTPFIVRSPDYYAHATIYAQDTFFTVPWYKTKVLKMKLGLEVTYFSKAYAYDYAPGLQQFFVYTNQQIGDYPIGNVFLLLGLKRTNIILRYDYANQGLPQKGYYTVHHYPMPDKLLKFGVNWKFYD